MRVTSFSITDVDFHESLKYYRFADFVNDKYLYENYFSLCCLLYHPQHKKIYCGMTAFNNDVLYSFDPVACEFESCSYQDVAEKYEVKVHHSLELDSDGMIYGTVGGLHEIDDYMKAPGGCVFRFDPASKKIEKLGIPIPHEYIQAITLDRQRKIIYGVTYITPRVFRFDLGTCTTKDLGPINCYPEAVALGEDGIFWTNWKDAAHKLNLLRYDPDKDEVKYFQGGIPSTPVVSPYYGKSYDNEIDTMADGGDGYLYIGTEIGMLYRLEPKTGDVQYLGKPLTELRITALEPGPDGLIYGVGGDNEHVELFTYDKKDGRLQTLGRIVDSETGKVCFRAHDICLMPDGKTVFVAETDTPTRPSHLWRCELQ